MKTLISDSIRLLVGASLSLLLTGCATQKLWNMTGAHSFCEPAPKPEVALFAAPAHDDILVEYTAISDRHDGLMRLAYFANANREQISIGKSPHFTNPNHDRNLVSVPIIELSRVTSNYISTNSFATIAENGRTFTVHRPNQKPEVNHLPDFPDDHGTFMRVALAPVTVVADTAMVGTAVAAVAAYLYAESGGSVTVR